MPLWIAILLDKTLFRRLLTIPAVIIAFGLVSLTMPILLTAGLLIDAFRAMSTATPAIVTRIVVFVWFYLLGELWAVITLGVVGLAGHHRALTATYRLQSAWTRWNLSALRGIFSMRFVVEGIEAVGKPPFLVLARHVSLIDSLLPASFIANDGGTRLRYVLKRELLVDPALDIAGNRLPNHFVDRGSGDSEAETRAIRRLARGMAPEEGVVIFPEGTRFSHEKLARQKLRFERKEGDLAAIGSGYRNVLAPRPAGTLALLDSTDIDVVILAHHGLEGLGGLGDVWSGRLVGSTVSIRFWRLPREEIPDGRTERSEWLYRTWADVDDWVSTKIATVANSR